MAFEAANIDRPLWRQKIGSLTPMEKMFAKRWLEKGWTTKGSETDFIARTSGKSSDPLIFRRIAAYYENEKAEIDPNELDIAGFQITYDFPDTPRDNVFTTGEYTGRYGEDNFSCRLLYDFLCRTFNDGEYFIDEYLKKDFKQTAVYRRFTEFRRNVLRHMAQELKEEKGRLRGTGSGARFTDVRGRFKNVADATMQDIRREFSRVVNGTLDRKVYKSTYEAAKAVSELMGQYGVSTAKIDKSRKSDSVYLYIRNIYENQLNPGAANGAAAGIRFSSDGHQNHQLAPDATVVIDTGKMLDDMLPVIMRELPDAVNSGSIKEGGAYETLKGSFIGSWQDFSIWRDEAYKKDLIDLGTDIKQDIISALSTRRLPLRKESLSKYTRDRRIKLGLNPNSVFYASGRLISSMNIYISLDREAV